MKEIKLKKTLLALFYLLTINLNAEEIINISQDDSNLSNRKEDNIKFAIELGGQTDFWNPGLSGNVLEYKTEGLILGFGKLKIKLYDSDVFTIEKYGTFNSSKNQDDLLSQYKNDQKEESTIDGLKISLQLMKVMNYLFDKDWIDGFNYEYNTKNFIGSATLRQNSIYWYGQTNNGILGEDYSLLERGNHLSFQTKFRSHKFSYIFDNILKDLNNSYLSVGFFDKEWSKPTFIGDSGLNGKLPIIFDSNYYFRGLSTIIGVKDRDYDLKAYFDYGLDNKMKIIQKGGDYSNYNKKVDMYTLGLQADYRFSNLYANKYFSLDVLVGGEMQYNQIIQDSNIPLDAETLYGVNMGMEIIF